MSDELDFPFQLTGKKRQQALERCRQVITEWGLTMGDGELLVLDFGLGRFEEVGEIEFWIANEEEAGYCGKFLFVDDGQTCPYHWHGRKHETFFMLKGTLRVVIDDEEQLLREGERLSLPPGKKHSFTGVGPALLLELSMPSTRGDNFFEDKAIADSGVL